MPESLDASVIIDELTANANKTLSSVLRSTPLQGFAVTSLGNLPYVWQDTRDVSLFNTLTYNWISSNLKGGADPIQLDGSFTNLYIQAINAVTWSLSKADQSALNLAANAATRQAAALQNAWIAAFGKLPGTTTSPIDDIVGVILTWTSKDPTPSLFDIQNAISLTDLLDRTPPAGQSILPVFVNWLDAIGSQLSLQNSVSMNNAYLARARRAVAQASQANGGLALNNGTFAPAYAVSPQVSDIENAMLQGSPVTMSMTVRQSSSDMFSVSVEGKVGFEIPIASLITIGVGGNANYFSSNLVTSENETIVEMSFPGVNLVNFGPVPFQQTGASTSWYWIDPIREAIRNGASDVSGFKFSPMPSIDFSAGGPFGYLMGAAISGYPTITITSKTANLQEVQKTFEQSASMSVSFLGIQLASGSESTYSNNVKVDAANSAVTITLAPPPQVVGGTVNAAQGWVLGVQPNYPAAA